MIKWFLAIFPGPIIVIPAKNPGFNKGIGANDTSFVKELR
jgi:hypothetical protein